MNKKRKFLFMNLILVVSLIFCMPCKATTYIDEDEVYRFIYGKTKEEIAQENALAQQQYYEEMLQLEKKDEEGKFIQVVRNENELFEAMCYQIKDYKEEMYYDTDNIELYHQLKGAIDHFWLYYCKDDPLVSGIYMKEYLLDGITYSPFEKIDRTETKYRIIVKLKYKYTKEEFDEHIKNMSELASKLKCDNDYESIKTVHDYLIDNIDYDKEYKNYDDLSGIKDGVMVCQGYAMATFNLLTNMGIPVRIISGKSVGNDGDVGEHAWNIVNVDGKWYNLDVTWDDAGENGINYQYFLKGSNDFPHHVPDSEYKEIAKQVCETSYPIKDDIAPESTETPIMDINDSGTSNHKNIIFEIWSVGYLIYVFVATSICSAPLIIMLVKHKKNVRRWKNMNDAVTKHYVGGKRATEYYKKINVFSIMEFIYVFLIFGLALVLWTIVKYLQGEAEYIIIILFIPMFLVLYFFYNSSAKKYNKTLENQIIVKGRVCGELIYKPFYPRDPALITVHYTYTDPIGVEHEDSRSIYRYFSNLDKWRAIYYNYAEVDVMLDDSNYKKSYLPMCETYSKRYRRLYLIQSKEMDLL
ncbi:MAG: hypothetical protein K6G76_00735 [Lachnospiraceae bacterium]|nr:hypothetical protein [Lachnospiraceae bacterium]